MMSLFESCLFSTFDNTPSSDDNIPPPDVNPENMILALKIINSMALIEFVNAKDPKTKNSFREIFNRSSIGLGRNSKDLIL